MKRIIECVPNFSEGRDLTVIGEITDAIDSVEGVALLDVDPGQATNRTVVTFAGDPERVIEAAVQAALVANRTIDMQRHQGEHPRFGAMDVCPLVPVSGVSMAETVDYARTLARRLGTEAGLTVYCYEEAATKDARRNLANVRAGEYEGLARRLSDPEWQPDFGPAEFNPRAGATAVGARDFLVAYNINLNTTSTRRANAVAFDVRERGRIKRDGNPLTGTVVRDADGKPVYQPGSLKAVKAIGWFIEEYGIAQISMNLTDISVTPVHVAFDEVCDRARQRGLRVTGSELVGLVPLEPLLEAGRHFLRKQHRSVGVPDSELIKIAVKSMGLDDLRPFEPTEKIIEYKLASLADDPLQLRDLTVRGFCEETASESPAPGGGSVAANVGALGAALGTMVANLSAHKRGWDDRWEEFSQYAETGKRLYESLLSLIDKDTAAFNAILDAYRLPKSNDEEELARQAAIQRAANQAMAVPLEVMRVSIECLPLAKAMAEVGNPASVSDAGVGALCARTAVRGAFLNVRINSSTLEDKDSAEKMLDEARELDRRAAELEQEVLELVEGNLLSQD